MGTPQEDVVLRREELYELVWAEPVRRAAARYGISDVALAKACRRLEIPLPQRGYWAKIAAGHPPNKPRFPAAWPSRLSPPKVVFDRTTTA